MENGKWKMENGKWKMENGKWKMNPKLVGNCSNLEWYLNETRMEFSDI